MRPILVLLGLLAGVALFLGGVALNCPPVGWVALLPLSVGAAALGGW